MGGGVWGDDGFCEALCEQLVMSAQCLLGSDDHFLLVSISYFLVIYKSKAGSTLAIQPFQIQHCPVILVEVMPEP